MLDAVILLFAHFVGDFVLQSDDVAKRKSKEWLILAEHVFVYGFPLAIATMLVSHDIPISNDSPVKFYFANLAAHFATDAVTSRITSKLYAQGKRHAFFVIIGLDQFLHAATLLMTLEWLR